MRDLHHLLAVLGKQLDEVVNNVVLVVVDSVAGVVRCKSILFFLYLFDIELSILFMGGQERSQLQLREAGEEWSRAQDWAAVAEDRPQVWGGGAGCESGNRQDGGGGEPRGWKVHHTKPWHDLGHLS